MELNREQVIKDLQEIVDNYSGSWQRFNVLDNALTLIKELTEENEKLKERVLAENHLRHQVEEMLADGMSVVKADTVKKMQEKILALSTYGTINISPWQLEQVVKEILEDEE